MTDQDAAAELSARYEAAWNVHDMTAFAELFHPDATFVNRVGHYWRGRDRIVEEHAAIHRTIYRDMTIRNRVLDIDPIVDGAVAVHVRCRATMGEAMPRGPRQLDTLFLYVAARRDGRWAIQAGENVAIIDPVTGQPVLSED